MWRARPLPGGQALMGTKAIPGLLVQSRCGTFVQVGRVAATLQVRRAWSASFAFCRTLGTMVECLGPSGADRSVSGSSTCR